MTKPDKRSLAMDRKALEVWERVKDPNYYGLRPVAVQCSLQTPDEDHVVAMNLVKCLCGKCVTCLKRREARRYHHKTRPIKAGTTLDRRLKRNKSAA